MIVIMLVVNTVEVVHWTGVLTLGTPGVAPTGVVAPVGVATGTETEGTPGMVEPTGLASVGTV